MTDQLEAARTTTWVEGEALPARVTSRTVLLVASFGAFLAFLDATVVNVAFPNMRESFPEASIGGLSWVLNAYNIVFASFLIIFGRLADLLGRKRLFLAGIAVFTLTSLLCAVAPSLDLLVLARVLQAGGAAMLVPASLAMVVDAFPQDHRSHAVGLWGATAAVAAGLGPPIGGALVEVGNWRWAFLVNLPFGLAAWWLTRRHLVESRAPGRRRMPDLRGAVLLAAALSLLTLGIVQGNDWGWSSVRVVASLLGAVVLSAGFVLSSRAHPQPLLDPQLLRLGTFSIANVLTVLAGMGFFAYMLTNILWLQYVWGYNILDAGLALVPGALVAAVAAGALGPIAQAHGYRRIIVPGALVWTAAYLWYALVVGEHPSFWADWLPGQVLSGIGVGATLPLLSSAALGVVPGGRFGTASAVMNSTRQLGGVLGIALLVVIIGTPTPDNAATVLRHGWLLCAACFALTAVGALLLRNTDGATEESTTDAAARVRLQLPESGVDEDAEPSAAVPVPAAERGTYLDRLPEQVRRTLVASGQEQSVSAGSWLFRTGDAADEMYVVVSGRLEVILEGVVIRELGAGSILGELALLTGGVRSAGVRARRDTTLLRISQADFSRALAQEPAAAMAVAAALAEDLQSPHPARDSGSSMPAVVSVVGLTAAAPAVEVGAVLGGAVGRHRRTTSVSDVSAQGLARAERDFERVLLTAPAVDEPDRQGWREFCLRQADQLVLVARAEDEPPTEWSGSAAPDLVLVGSRPSAERLASWCDVLHPWQVTVVGEDDLAGGLRSLAARISGRALGLVLAGGGARGLTHVGVLLELEDAGIVVDRVAGASLGAIVAGLYAGGRDAATVESVCYEEFVRRKPFGDYTFPVAGLAKGRRANQALSRRFGADTRIETLPRQFRCVSTDLLARTSVAHRSGLLWEAVAASIRLPVLFPPQRSQGRLLVDGGVLDNLPVDLLVERDEGPLVAVNIGVGGGGGVPAGKPLRIPGLGETLLRTMMIGSANAVENARAAGAYVITPPSLGVGMLEFHQLDTMVKAGRAAGRALLEATDGLLTS